MPGGLWGGYTRDLGDHRATGYLYSREVTHGVEAALEPYLEETRLGRGANRSQERQKGLLQKTEKNQERQASSGRAGLWEQGRRHPENRLAQVREGDGKSVMRQGLRWAQDPGGRCTQALVRMNTHSWLVLRLREVPSNPLNGFGLEKLSSHRFPSLHGPCGSCFLLISHRGTPI